MDKTKIPSKIVQIDGVRDGRPFCHINPNSITKFKMGKKKLPGLLDPTQNDENKKPKIDKIIDTEMESINENAINNNSDKNEDNKIKYIRTDKGPFFVIVEKQDMNLYKLSKELKTINIINIVNIEIINKRKAKILFKTWYDANKIINNEFLMKNEYSCFIPEMYVNTVGVIRGLPLDITIDDIRLNHECTEQLIHAERITRWNASEKRAESTETIKLTFRSKNLPDKIKIYDILSKLDYYVPNPIFCVKCLNYGHKQKYCKGVERCNTCAANLPNDLQKEEGQIHTCDNIANCKHCGPGHKSNDYKLCNERKRQIKINKYMVVEKVSYIESVKHFFKQKNISHSHQNFPNPVWNVNKDEDPQKVNKLNHQINHLENELQKFVSFFKNVQQMIAQGVSSGSAKVSNDLILFDIGAECQKIITQSKQTK